MSRLFGKPVFAVMISDSCFAHHRCFWYDLAEHEAPSAVPYILSTAFSDSNAVILNR